MHYSMCCTQTPIRRLNDCWCRKLICVQVCVQNGHTPLAKGDQLGIEHLTGRLDPFLTVTTYSPGSRCRSRVTVRTVSNGDYLCPRGSPAHVIASVPFKLPFVDGKHFTPTAVALGATIWRLSAQSAAIDFAQAWISTV